MSSYQHYLTTLTITEHLDTVDDLNDGDQPLYHDLTKQSLAYFNTHM